MEKRNTILLTVIAMATLIVTIIGASFAYFASTVNTANGNLNVDLNLPNNTASFIATAGDPINITVDSYMMQEGDATDGGNTSNNTTIAANLTKNSTLNVELTAADQNQKEPSQCTYDIVFEWTSNGDFSSLKTAADEKTNSEEIYPSNYYVRTQPDSKFTTEFKEFTIACMQTVNDGTEERPTTDELFEEKNIDQFKCADGSCKKIKLAEGETLSTTTSASVEYNFTVRFYNLNHDQSTLAGKSFTGNIKVDNVVC